MHAQKYNTTTRVHEALLQGDTHWARVDWATVGLILTKYIGMRNFSHMASYAAYDMQSFC